MRNFLAVFFVLFWVIGLAVAQTPDISVFTNADSAAPRETDLFVDNEIKSAISRSPNSPALHDLLGQYFYRKKRYSDALKQFETAISLNPFDMTARFSAGMSWEKIGDYPRALREYEKEIQWSNARADFRRAVCYLHLCQYRQALHCLRTVRQTKEHPAAHYETALALAGIYRYSEAIRELQKGFAVDENFAVGKQFFSSFGQAEQIQNAWRIEAGKELAGAGVLASILLVFGTALGFRLADVKLPWSFKVSWPKFGRPIITSEDF